jgi:3-hydroxybutyrate dehydrogenase
MTARQVLITGAGSGIGAALAQHLAAQGHRVAVSDANLPAAQALAKEISARGQDAQALELDVTDVRSIDAALRALRSPVEILVNNAGLQDVARLEEQSPERWALLVDVMLKGTALTTRAVLPAMSAANWGRIINIGSIHSLVASPFKSAYVAAKHGLVGFAKAVALETAAREITINTICPAYVLTPLVRAQVSAQAREHGMSEEQVIAEIMLRPMPKRRFIEMSEVAAALDFLLGDAARNVTGQCLVIDGGWTAH